MNIQKALFFFLLTVLAFTAIAAEQNTATWKTYRDTRDGFEIKFPTSAVLENQNFVSPEYYVFYGEQSWRSVATVPLDAGPNSPGTQILSFMTFFKHTSTDDLSSPKATNPADFETGLNIGVSDDPIDVANCIKSSGSTVKINGTTFHTFELGTAGMCQFFDGVSYRTLHNNKCFALEQTEAGVNAADTSVRIPEAVLQDYYNRAYPILQTFKFIPAK